MDDDTQITGSETNELEETQQDSPTTGTTTSGHEPIRPIVQKYVDLCEKIKNLREESASLTSEKNDLEQTIKDYMIAQQITVVNLSGENGGRLIRTQTKQSSPLNKETLKEAISGKVTANVAEEITKQVFEQRPVKQVDKIKVVKTKSAR